MINFLRRHDNKKSFPVGGQHPSGTDYSAASAENAARKNVLVQGDRQLALKDILKMDPFEIAQDKGFSHRVHEFLEQELNNFHLTMDVDSRLQNKEYERTRRYHQDLGTIIDLKSLHKGTWLFGVDFPKGKARIFYIKDGKPMSAMLHAMNAKLSQQHGWVYDLYGEAGWHPAEQAIANLAQRVHGDRSYFNGQSL